jgi:hypothetical protein
MGKKEKFLGFIFLAILYMYPLPIVAQQWGEYTLYSISNSTNAYLIDTNGTTYHTWTFPSTAKTGYSSYLMPGGTLVRTVAKTGNSLSGGGMTGRVQKVDYNGTVIWDYTHSSASYCLHHDICPLPNGNVLMISYEVKTAANATQAGSSQSIVMWSEKIIEVQPTGATTGNIVWEWHLWDHLCQNVNSTKDNYVTSIVQNPQLININYKNTKDWIHMNGIDYNATLNQIVVSSHNLNEVWVIDHSTTTAEAASHSGGNSGKGGDILYRWGNPTAYGASGTTIFNVVHDAHWIPYDCPRGGSLAAFNNKGGTGSKTAIDIFNPPLNVYNYDLILGSAYTPSASNWRHTSTSSTTNEGNSQLLPNGNLLVCIAMSGYMYEIDSNQNILWTKTVTGTVAQAFRYTRDYVLGTMSVTANASNPAICTGDSTQLNATATTAGTYTYSWTSNPAGFTSALQNPFVTPTINTTYTVTMSDGINSANSSVNIIVNQLPTTPVITLIGNVLSSTSAAAYQWYLNNAIIPGATSQNYIPLQNGNYQVIITNAGGCKSTLSAVYAVSNTGITMLQNQSFSLYPNPTDGIINIKNINEYNDFIVMVIDITGKKCFEKANEKQIDISSLDNGMYFLEIFSQNKKVYSTKISLNK